MFAENWFSVLNVTWDLILRSLLCLVNERTAVVYYKIFGRNILSFYCSLFLRKSDLIYFIFSFYLYNCFFIKLAHKYKLGNRKQPKKIRCEKTGKEKFSTIEPPVKGEENIVHCFGGKEGVEPELQYRKNLIDLIMCCNFHKLYRGPLSSICLIQ